jgi:SAM-dependent methyltransferase
VGHQLGRRQGLTDHRHWFEDIAEFLGPAYLKYSFTKGTQQEVGFLMEALDLEAGSRLLDVGCGPGRHALAFAALGIDVVGVDISDAFIALAAKDAPPNAEFVRGDARVLPYDGEFDAVISLCQGAFGLPAAAGDDDAVLQGMARALRPGGRVALSAFSAYFAIRHLEEGETFDAAAGVNHEQTSVRNTDGATRDVDLWTACFTPRELRLLMSRVGLDCLSIWSVAPGVYSQSPPTIDRPEFLVIAEKPQ